jgi:predicted component of type VI protein secretion system
MSVLRNLESKIADLVEGTFGRVFRSEVRPVELARGLAKEMDQHRTVSVSRVYVPNEYVIWLSPDDRARFEGVEQEISDELGAYLLEHARREKLALVSRPKVGFDTDEALKLGEFGIQARLVRAAAEGRAEQGDHGHTMVYSTSERLREELDRPGPGGDAPAPGRAMVHAEGKRMLVSQGGAVIGRSRDCDIVLSDPNVSRRHAEIRADARGGWVVHDLGSTNGVRVNGTRVAGSSPLQPGDRIAVGTAEIRFAVE